MTSSKGFWLPPGGVGLEVGSASSSEACWPGLGFGLEFGLRVKGEG